MFLRRREEKFSRNEKIFQKYRFWVKRLELELKVRQWLCSVVLQSIKLLNFVKKFEVCQLYLESLNIDLWGWRWRAQKIETDTVTPAGTETSSIELKARLSTNWP